MQEMTCTSSSGRPTSPERSASGAIPNHGSGLLNCSKGPRLSVVRSASFIRDNIPRSELRQNSFSKTVPSRRKDMLSQAGHEIRNRADGRKKNGQEKRAPTSRANVKLELPSAWFLMLGYWIFSGSWILD